MRHGGLHSVFILLLALAGPLEAADGAANYSAPASPTMPTPAISDHISLGSLTGMDTSASSSNALEYALLNGSVWLDARYRYENVAQNGIARDAAASTLRSRIGYETGAFDGFKVGFELQNIRDIGAEHFNNGINGKTLYPTVSDAEDTNVNQAYLSYQALPGTEIKVGRQLILLDDQRFVGQSDWRQHDTTYDAGSIYSTYFDRTTLFYAYVRQVNRIYGDDSPIGKFIGDSHLFNASYTVAPILKVTGYSYLLDFESATPAINTLSNATYGLRFTGKYPVDAFTLSYTAQGAHQTSYGDNPNGISENYYLIEPTISAYGVTGKLGYEMLEGNGHNAFQTPLASYHLFDGWADKFVPTPINGLLDRYATVVYKLPFGGEWFKDTELTGTFRQFNSDAGDRDDGHEWDGLISHTFWDHYTTALEIADYKANALFTDTTKIMAWLRIKY